MMYVVLVIVALTLLKHADASVRCFECTDMPHPQDCQVITTCSSHEICFVEQFVTSGGQILYSSGCLSKERCQTSGKRSALSKIANIGKSYPISNALSAPPRDSLSRRQDTGSKTDIPTCVECCNGEFCNVEGCGTTAVPRTKRGPRCFSCDAQADPESCRDTMLCDTEQVCAIFIPLNSLAQNEWASDCMSERQCNTIVNLEMQKLGMAIGKRDLITITQCPRCCTTDFCNHSCRQNVTVTHATAVPTKPSTHSTTKQVVKYSIHQSTQYVHVTPKPTVAHAHNTTKSPDVHAHHTTKPTTAHAHHTTKSTAAHAHHTTKSTAAHAHHITKSTAALAHHTKISTAAHAHHTTKPTPAHAHHTTKSTAAHTQHTTKSQTTAAKVIITQTTHPLPTTDPAVGCKVDGYIYDAPTKLCLKFFESPKLNWTDAQRYCNSSKGQLAIITGDQKIKDVLAFYKSGGHKNPLWVGATDFGNGHVFTFTDGSKITVDPSKGQDLKTSNCLYVFGGTYEGFGPCPDLHGFICERSSTIRA
ncbi:uncharacterized protein LOC132735620 [Ruditapes philippinarum]|uniref:uncharacterized protein LOC132735620 n=1 Tax=Ruditapes philippinarum TaxID=129788 RepID=UPI00295BAB0D|nr:uncharacterized protein LOC132735620 [Ruditapes philippinarum]